MYSMLLFLMDDYDKFVQRAKNHLAIGEHAKLSQFLKLNIFP